MTWILQGRVHSLGEGRDRACKTNTSRRQISIESIGKSEGGVVTGESEVAGDEKPTIEELEQKVKELESTLVENWEYNEKDCDNKVPILKVLAQEKRPND